MTIALSWAAVHTTFALHYAHEYYRGTKPGGLQFPSGDQHEDADYWDFVYFSFVIGMTAQVSDVGITDKTIRRTATAHGVISFIYNTALVALMVNIAASATLIHRRLQQIALKPHTDQLQISSVADFDVAAAAGYAAALRGGAELDPASPLDRMAGMVVADDTALLRPGGRAARQPWARRSWRDSRR